MADPKDEAERVARLVASAVGRSTDTLEGLAVEVAAILRKEYDAQARQEDVDQAYRMALTDADAELEAMQARVGGEGNLQVQIAACRAVVSVLARK